MELPDAKENSYYMVRKITGILTKRWKYGKRKDEEKRHVHHPGSLPKQWRAGEGIDGKGNIYKAHEGPGLD